MIAIDTNVLLRYLLQDDKKQSARANKLIAGNKKVLITDIVLVETIWTLEGKKYKLAKQDLLLVLDGLFKEPNVIFEHAQTVWRAYNTFRAARVVKAGLKNKGLGFADALILEKSKYTAVQNKELFDGLYTFDVSLQQLDAVNKP